MGQFEQQTISEARARHVRLWGVPPNVPKPVVVERPVPEPEPESPPIDKEIARAIAFRALQDQVASLSMQLSKMLDEDSSPIVRSSCVKPIAAVVAKFYGVTLRDLISPRRTAVVVRPRHVAMYLAKELTTKSLPAIGLVFMRDHTTVLNAICKIAEMRRIDPELDREIEQLISILTAGQNND